MRTRRVLTCAAAALALTAAGCSGGSDDQPEDPMQGTLRVWTHVNKSFNKEYKALAADYMAQHEGVEIDFESFDYDSYVQTLQTSLPAGTEADVLQMFGSWVCSYQDNLASTPESVVSLTDAQDTYFPGPLGGYQCDDRLYGLPEESNVEYGAILLNTAMADDAGVPTTGWDSYDDFVADAKKLTVVEDGVITRAGYHFTTNDGIAYTFLSLILQSGGEFLDGDTFTFDTDEGRQALELMKRFVDEDIIDPALFTDTTNWVGDCYFTELCASGLVGPWVVPEYEADFPDVVERTVYAPLPTLENSSFAADSGWGLTVSGNSERQELAWDFVKFVANDPDNALQWNLATGTLPALRTNAEGAAREQLVAERPYMETFMDILGDAKYLGALEDRDRLFYDVIVPNATKAMTGDMSVDDALAAIEEDANGL